MKLAAINDFHGYLQASSEQLFGGKPGKTAKPRTLGGITRLAALVDTLRSQHRYFAFVSSGDLIGASPLISGAFADEPTIETMNAGRPRFQWPRQSRV